MMDNLSVEDERKPFEASMETFHEEETLPDPDEELMLDQGHGSAWLVKIPKHLMERWSSINVDDVHLASFRIYPNSAGPSGKKPRIVLFLPPSPGEAGSATTNNQVNQDPSRPLFTPNFAHTTHRPVGEPDAYELEMIHDSVENQLVVAEQPKDLFLGVAPSRPINHRAHTTILTGRIKCEYNLRPVLSASYRKQMRERSRKYNTPERHIKRIEEADLPGGRGAINRLSSGVALGAGNTFGNLNRSKPKHAKGTFERMARMPRNQLLDLIFNFFRDTPRWRFKSLRVKTQQPETYLKEVLSEVADLHRSGEYNGLWELKDHFKDDEIKTGFTSTMGGILGDTKAEDGGEGEEDEDEDMEKIS